MASTPNGLAVEIVDRIAHVTLDRPERLNALSTGLIAELIEAFDRFSADDDVWAVLLTGRGERAFSAGIDLKEMNEADQSQRAPTLPMRGVQRNVFEVILECTKPVVAALNGVAVGGGCEVALACDIRFAADHVRIGLPEAKRGLGANFGCQLLPRLIPRGIAYELLYSGELISAEQAQRWGLVNRVMPADVLMEQATDFCRQLVANAPLTLRRYKAMIGKGAELPLAAALRLHVGPNPYHSEDRAEGVAAFLEKRPPVWQAR
ncbi:enoyl-CoA hydratase/isomerase family protein [Salinisphaera sp. T31B1]|uniref:enoyl-CoA hydratase/isomerase family protein n=1 Tax=Salinisphaera sp. T31B1 TaxID=727963 RepID=UPI0033402258